MGPTRQAYTDGIAARLAPDDPLSARTKTLSVYAMMAGTLQLSGALPDGRLADELRSSSATTWPVWWSRSARQ